MSSKETLTNTKEEKKQQIRTTREKEESTRKFKSILIKIAIFAVIFVLLSGIIFVFTRQPTERTDLGQTFAEQSREHIAQGSTSHQPYSTNPPTSGPHWPNPSECKIFTEEIPDESALHGLEHGAVWITYKDKSDTKLVSELTTLVQNYPEKVILSPRSKNDDNIAVVSWKRLMVMDSFDSDKINSFIKNFRNEAPEPLASCGEKSGNS